MYRVYIDDELYYSTDVWVEAVDEYYAHYSDVASVELRERGVLLFSNYN